jgi:hypothetical protein
MRTSQYQEGGREDSRTDSSVEDQEKYCRLANQLVCRRSHIEAL